MYSKISLIVSLLHIYKVSAHLILNIPEVWGINNGEDLEYPLDTTSSNFICAGKTPENNGIVKFVAGQNYNLPVTCGEKDINAPGCLIGDWHTGDAANDYPGCALSVSYNGYNSPEDFKYISYSKDCAKRGTTTSFIITQNIQNCEKCICSWSLAPSREYSSPGQFYHNCFYCSISGGTTNSTSTMRSLDFINVKGTQYQDVTYNDINPSNIYTQQPPQQLPQRPPQQLPQQLPQQPPQQLPQRPPQQLPQQLPQQPPQQLPLQQPPQPRPPQQLPQQLPQDSTLIDYELFKEFKEYQKYIKYNTKLTEDCDDDDVNEDIKHAKMYKRHLGPHNNHHDHHNNQVNSILIKVESTPTPTIAKVCRYKTITRTICKPTNTGL